jgi:hypothetical protein
MMIWMMLSCQKKMMTMTMRMSQTTKFSLTNGLG